MAVLIDSGVVVGFLDRTDSHHSAARQRITALVTAGEPLLTSVVTYAEVLVVSNAAITSDVRRMRSSH